MKNDFDKILSSKIKQSFNNYEVEYNPANWDLLKARLLKQKRRKMAFFIITSAAAVLVFGMIISTYFFNNEKQNFNQSIAKNIEPKQNSNVKVVNQNTETKTKTENNLAEAKQKPIISDGNTHKNIASNNINTEKSKFQKIEKTKNQNIENSKIEEKTQNVQILEPNEKLQAQNETIIEKIVESEKNIEQKEIANIENVKIDTIEPQKSIIIQKDEIADKKEIFYEDSEDEKKSNNFNISVLLTSQMNNTKNAENQDVNVGGGVSTDLALVSKTDLQVGMVVSKQSVNFVNQNLKSLNTTPAESNLQYVSFSVPINLKYNIKENSKRDIFVSAGFSSIGYLHENYEYNYDVATTETSLEANVDGQILAVQKDASYNKQENVEINGMNKFDLAGQLNLSGGIGYNLSKKMKLQIEPYFKIPLRKLATDNILFTSGGINLYLKFSTGKK